MANVKANRVIAVSTEQERRQAPLDSNTNKISEGRFDGQAMMYVKGPEGEQLEFLQVLGRAKQVYVDGYEARRRAMQRRLGSHSMLTDGAGDGAPPTDRRRRE